MTDSSAPALSPEAVQALTEQKIPDEVLKAITEGAPPQPRPKFILTNKPYFNQDGLRIDESILVSGAFPADYPKFVAHAVVKITLPLVPGQKLTPGQEAPSHKQPIQVPIKANTIEEAYACAPPLLQDAANGWQTQFEQSMLDRAAQAQMRKKLTKDDPKPKVGDKVETKDDAE